MTTSFSPTCRQCPRLAAFLAEVSAQHPDYYCQAVAPFGVATPALLIVGLAPGLHGANRTGRPFTGDFAGQLLYQTLHRFGFASSPEPLDAQGCANHALQLQHCRITNAVKCLPPANKPTPAEIKQCNTYLATELHSLRAGTAVLALGQIAHQAVLRAAGVRASACRFTHGAHYALANHGSTLDLHLWDSYHCSRYNTQTRRLTPAMFEAVFAAITAAWEQ